MNRILIRTALAAFAVAGAATLAVTSIPAHAAPVNHHKPASTFIATGQSLRGAPLYKPACRTIFSCALSGDSTAFLYRMHWSTWSDTKAVGTGTYLLNDCLPNCATGHFLRVPAVVTFTRPVRACVHRSVRWYWTRASFRYPMGLPPQLRGSNAPLNPWNFVGLAQDAKASCR